MSTLQFGPFWILSAIAGTYKRFKSYELEAFWDTPVAAAVRMSGVARGILQIHDRTEPTKSSDLRLALLRIGVGIARIRGPYGRTISPEHEQLLELIAVLLEMDFAPHIGDVLV